MKQDFILSTQLHVKLSCGSSRLKRRRALPARIISHLGFFALAFLAGAAWLADEGRNGSGSVDVFRYYTLYSIINIYRINNNTYGIRFLRLRHDG